MIKNVLIGLLLVLLSAGLVLLYMKNSRLEPAPQHDTDESASLEGREDDEGHPNHEEGHTEQGSSEIYGTWRSLDDAQSVITFHPDGSVTDIYGGGALVETGSYQLFEGVDNLPLDFPELATGLYLRQSFGGEDYYYEITELDKGYLELIFVSGRGNILRYERVSS